MAVIKKRTILHAENDPNVEIYPDILESNLPDSVTAKINGALQAGGLTIFGNYLTAGDADYLIGRDELGNTEVGNEDLSTIIVGSELKYRDFEGNEYNILTDKPAAKTMKAIEPVNPFNDLITSLIKAFKLEDLEFKEIDDNVDLSLFDFNVLKLHQLIGKLKPQNGERKLIKLGVNKDKLSNDDLLLADSKGWDIL